MIWTRKNFWRFGQGDLGDPPDENDRHLSGDVLRQYDSITPYVEWIPFVGDGVTANYENQLSNDIQIEPGQIVFSYIYNNQIYSAYDNGDGYVYEGETSIGWISYTSGQYNITFLNAPSLNSYILFRSSGVSEDTRTIDPSEAMYPYAKFPADDPRGRGILRYILYIVQSIFLDGTTSFIDKDGNTISAIEALKSEIKRMGDLIDPDTIPKDFLVYLARTIGYEFIFSNLIMPPPNPIPIPEEYPPPVIPGIGVVGQTEYDLNGEMKRRNEVKWATNFYSLKGVPKGYEILFESVGRKVSILYVWSKNSDRSIKVYLSFGKIPDANYIGPNLLPVENWVYYPDSKIRVQPDLYYFSGLTAAVFNQIIQRIEEVIPAHLLYEVVLMLGLTGSDGDYFPISDTTFLKLIFGIDGNGNGVFVDIFRWRPIECLTHGSECFPPVRHDGIAIADHNMQWDMYEVYPFVHKYDPAVYGYRGYCEYHDNSVDPMHDNDCQTDKLEVYVNSVLKYESTGSDTGITY